ncbi:MAG TPA: glycosyltransferase family 4 protein [Bryobacteraceae bacterium]|nr:glycosyltransferase family 4 protein [Bryobacteraceae bacterium]
MRALHLDAGRKMRGGQWQALRLVQGLGCERVESTLLARRGSPLFEAAQKAGCRVEPLGIARAAALARRHDVVHAHDSLSHTVAALAGGAPLVVSRRVAFPGASGLAARWKYGRAARYIAVSEFVKSTLIERGVAREKIDVVYDGVPLLKPGEPEEELRIVAPYSRDPLKGQWLMRAAAQRAGVGVRFSGSLEDSLPGASLFLYITMSEGLGSGALLAMSAGVAVIASKVGGLPEIVRHGENGWLVENDAEAIAEAIRHLASDADLRRGLGAAGRRTVEERFTVDRMVRRTMEVYRTALDED